MLESSKAFTLLLFSETRLELKETRSNESACRSIILRCVERCLSSVGSPNPTSPSSCIFLFFTMHLISERILRSREESISCARIFFLRIRWSQKTHTRLQAFVNSKFTIQGYCTVCFTSAVMRKGINALKSHQFYPSILYSYVVFPYTI